MKSFSLVVLLSFVIHFVSGQTVVETSLIPQPVSIEKRNGQFVLSASTGIVAADNNEEVQKVIGMFSDAARRSTGYPLAIQRSQNDLSSAISFSLNKTQDAVLGKEGYVLDVSPAAVSIQANTPAGLFYGMQSLLQLLPKEIESKTAVQNMSWTIPAVKVTDFPRFGWRGLMFDVSRHFFTKERGKGFY